MNRSLKLSILLALALGSTQLLAVDLGQIQVKSALGQPLLAEIPVLKATPAELQHLTAQLASSEEFARAGITGGRTTIPLQFNVADTAGGKHVIRITSAAAVDDPYLDLLVEVNAPSGKSLREFTILLDPPGRAATAAATPATSPGRAKSTSPRTQGADVPAARTAPVAKAGAAAKAAPTVANGEYGPVKPGQTLSGIVRSTTPAGVDLRQMLLAIKQANPDAFYHDNINALKAGAILRVPTAAEAQTVAVAAAIAEVQRQNSDWRAQTAANPVTVADAATRTATPSTPTGSASGATDRLALLPARDNGSATAKDGGNAAGSKAGQSAATVRQDLLRTQESLASVQQQTTDLKVRLKDLTDINAKNTRLLSLKDSEIAELQAKLAAARHGAGAAPVAAGSAAAMHAATATLAAAMTTAQPSAAGPASAITAVATTSVPAAATTTLAAASAPVVAASASLPATMAASAARPAPKAVITGTPNVDVGPWYMQAWAWAVGALVIVLLLVLALLGRRRKRVVRTVATGTPSLADQFGPTPVANGELDGGIDPDDVDQDELLDQLAEHPDDIDLHLELATLYYSRRDVEHFEAAAEAMHAHITDPQQDEWQDVLHMGEDLVPGHPLFDQRAQAPVTAEDDALASFDIDDYADDAVAADPAPASAGPAAEPSPVPKKVGGYAFDFDLTRHPLPSASAPPVAEHTLDSEVTHVRMPDESAVTLGGDPSAGIASAGDADDLREFNDDPIDTKLDLARAYLDMGDAEGARAMLGEVIKEGSQMQKDVATGLLASVQA